MANEPERPIETVLRAYAEQRRRQSGPPAELHPANRRLLQAEVAGLVRAQTSGRQGFMGLLRTAWPRFAWGFALLIGLGLVGRHFFPVFTQPNPVIELAKKEKTQYPTPAAALKAPELAENRVLSEKPSELAAAAPIGSSVIDTVNDNSSSPTLDQNLAGTQNKPNATLASRELIRAESAVPAAVPSQTASMLFAQATREQEKQQQQFTQEFKRAAVTDGNARKANNGPAAAGSLLATFRVEQTGQAVRVIDNDGSVYTGTLTLAQDTATIAVARPLRLRQGIETAGRDSAQGRSAVAPPAGNAITGLLQAYSFRVAGTNLSLKQQVVFSGQLLPLAGSKGGLEISNTPAWVAGGPLPTPAQAGFPPIPECRIQGKAVVDGGPEISINALPTK